LYLHSANWFLIIRLLWGLLFFFCKKSCSSLKLVLLLNCSWIDAAKFLTGASAVGSLAIPIILRHANMIETGAMFMCFHRASLEDDW
ncbi:unnamed protein product, partial [Linum tenue]